MMPGFILIKTFVMSGIHTVPEAAAAKHYLRSISEYSTFLYFY
ncbi:hypothetical protein CZ787_07590 [Halomonas citrativorans]|uniref:Uncharacterized protein n=1 Tax=Halomonas citrativorans TaxID=2742612 RepID=A0A1R4HXC8_9GAMM|nr:hypothetical protein CZ787_07590 [Halomonas citrativorans]